MDVSLVFNSIPRERREFDSDPVKAPCEEYSVYFLNPTRIYERNDKADTIEWMYRNGKRFHVTNE